MKMTKIIVVFLVAASFVFAGVIGADAVCGQYGKIAQIYVAGGTTSTYAIVYLQRITSGVTNSYYHYYRTDKPGVLDVLSSAFAANHTVYIAGNAAACPSSGIARYGGYIRSARVYNTR